jgi:hypothetical protein
MKERPPPPLNATPTTTTERPPPPLMRVVPASLAAVFSMSGRVCVGWSAGVVLVGVLVSWSVCWCVC